MTDSKIPFDTVNISEKRGPDTDTSKSSPSSNNMDSANSARPKPQASAKDHHAHFRNMIGIGVPKNFYKRVNNAYYWHTFQYWFTACMINGLLLAQIIIGALVTGFGSSERRDLRRAIVWLGGTNTVIAAVLAYFKSRNQPNRARQFRSGLAAVRDAIADAEADFAGAIDAGHVDDGAPGNTGPGSKPSLSHYDIEERVARLRKMYYDARKDAETNYPDLWVKYGDAVDRVAKDISDKSKNTMVPKPGLETRSEGTSTGTQGTEDTIQQVPPNQDTTGDPAIGGVPRTNTISVDPKVR